MASSGTIERQTIGRHGIIGSLYDIRTDQLEGGSLFNNELPSSFIKIIDSANVSYRLDSHNSQKETFNNLNIETSLKLGLLGGLVSVGGSAKYLNLTKTNSSTVRVTFIYQMKTKQEHLLISTAGLREYFAYDAFENPNATHIVIGIKWGANVAATFERTAHSREAAKKIEGSLLATFTQPSPDITVQGQVKVNYDNEQKADLESLKISFSGDVMIESCPQTIDEVLGVFKNVPSLIKSLNDGKGQQITFILYPLKRIAEMYKIELKTERLINEVSEHIGGRIETIFEQINDGVRQFNDFLDDIKSWEQFISRDWLGSIKQKQRELVQDELEIKRQLSSLLVQIRSGSAAESQMVELLDKFESENPCSLMSIERFLKANQRVKTKIETLTRFNPQKTELFTNIKSINKFILDSYVSDVYLLHICEQWQVRDFRNFVRQESYFSRLMETEKEANNTKAIFRVIDHDLHSDMDEKPIDCVIYYAKNGSIESYDSYKDSLSKFVIDKVKRSL